MGTQLLDFGMLLCGGVSGLLASLFGPMALDMPAIGHSSVMPFSEEHPVLFWAGMVGILALLVLLAVWSARHDTMRPTDTGADRDSTHRLVS